MTPFGSRDWLDSIYRPLRGRFREVIAISLFVNLLALALPVFILQVYDRVVMHNGLSTLNALALGMVVILFFDFLLRQTRSKILQWSAVRVDGQLGEKIYDKILSLPLPVLEQRSTNDWMILFRDVDIIRNSDLIYMFTLFLKVFSILKCPFFIVINDYTILVIRSRQLFHPCE